MPGTALRLDAELMSKGPRTLEASGEVGQFLEALREAQPGRAAVWR
jgi:hypothetical protein